MYVIFRVGSELYGTSVSYVEGTHRMQEITRVPRAPHYYEGVINLRGNVVPVLDMHKRFNLESRQDTHFTRIIICRIDDRAVGMIVDEVVETAEIEQSQMETPPDVISANDRACIEAVGKMDDRLVVLLNIHRVFGIEDSISRSLG